MQDGAFKVTGKPGRQVIGGRQQKVDGTGQPVHNRRTPGRLDANPRVARRGRAAGWLQQGVRKGQNVREGRRRFFRWAALLRKNGMSERQFSVFDPVAQPAGKGFMMT